MAQYLTNRQQMGSRKAQTYLPIDHLHTPLHVMPRALELAVYRFRVEGSGFRFVLGFRTKLWHAFRTS
jgi:hypothetical protein